MFRRLQKYGLQSLIRFLPIVPTVLLVSCTQAEKPPADLIPEDEMVDILQSVFIAEVKAISQYELRLDKHAYMKYELYPALFDSLGINDSAFYRSYNWYESQPALFEIMLDSVTARVERAPVVQPDSSEGEGKTLDQVYQELNRIESVRSGESRQPFEER